jgi:8-hydroxy-5-deazaflavin:NADPH oxidoreductase
MVGPMVVGIIGGTGPLGAGLGLRLAASGSSVVIGSRDKDRAASVVNDLVARWPDRGLDIRGLVNSEAARCETVVVATPWEGAVDTVTPLVDDLAGRVVVSVGNALVRNGHEFQAVAPPRGSVAALLAAALPRSRVSAACHHLPAADLKDLDAQLDSDVLVCSDDAEAGEVTMDMLSAIEGLRPLFAGSLASASAIEALTAVLVTLNVKYRAHSSLKISGIADAHVSEARVFERGGHGPV